MLEFRPCAWFEGGAQCCRVDGAICVVAAMAVAKAGFSGINRSTEQLILALKSGRDKAPRSPGTLQQRPVDQKQDRECSR